MKYSFTIDGMLFKSKTAVTNYVREQIYRCYPDNVDITPEHLRFMVGLLSYHPWAEQKIGSGVRRMWIAKNQDFPTRGFFLERMDGSTTDFSFLQCVQGGSAERDFREACRAAIVPDILAFKESAFSRGGVVCPFRGCVLTPDNCHIDHAPPNTFAVILAAFIESGVKPETVAIKHDDNDAGSKFADDALRSRWIAFHNERAQLRVLSKEANLSDARASGA